MRHLKISNFSSNDFFVCKTFTCVFLRYINSRQILLICHSNHIHTLQQVGRAEEIDQSQNTIYFSKVRILQKLVSQKPSLEIHITKCWDNSVYRRDELGLNFSDQENCSKQSMRYHKII